jgi:molybdopterin adenylyltransferase
MGHGHQSTVVPRVATLTISDTRTIADDKSGDTLRLLLQNAGFILLEHAMVRDDIHSIQETIRTLAQRTDIDVIVATGGTGITPRDHTWEAVAPLLDKTLDGFGEAFRRLSWDEIGVRSILSRAIAGTVGQTLVVALPGSTNAVRLAVNKILAEMLPHAVALTRG